MVFLLESARAWSWTLQRSWRYSLENPSAIRSTLLADAEDPLISAATLVEASLVMQAKTGAAGVADLDDLLAAGAVRCVAVDRSQAQRARDAFARFGKGRAAAALNFGDCFSYALAQVTDKPLLYKGDDFSQTDITPARA